MRYPSAGVRPNKPQQGFTLVEIAIVLVITGLLVGALLKGQEMVTNSRLKKIEKDGASIAAAMFTYQDRYKQFPGDDYRASSRFEIYTDGFNDPAPADIEGDGSGTIDGNWVGAVNTETANFWKHLRAAGLIPGDPDDETQPRNAFGGDIGIRDGSLLVPGHTLIFGSIEGPIAKILESRLDDGAPNSGRLQSDLTVALMDGLVASSAGANYLDSTRYFMAFGM